jgi:hypothetical protein
MSIWIWILLGVIVAMVIIIWILASAVSSMVGIITEVGKAFWR